MGAKLYHFELSHPSHAVRLMLEHKGVGFDTATLLPGTQPLMVRLAGFRGATVPALKLDGRKLQGSLTISRELERLYPDRPLFGEGEGIEEAERWGHDVLQPIPRRVFRWCVGADRELRRWVARDSGMPLAPVMAEALAPIVWALKRQSGATADSVRRDLAELPAHLDHIDELISSGTLDGPELNAADYQIGTSARVLLEFDGVREHIEGRPAAAHARRVLPDYPAAPVTVSGWL